MQCLYFAKKLFILKVCYWNHGQISLELKLNINLRFNFNIHHQSYSLKGSKKSRRLILYICIPLLCPAISVILNHSTDQIYKFIRLQTLTFFSLFFSMQASPRLRDLTWRGKYWGQSSRIW